LLIKPFFDVPAENSRNHLCRFKRLKPERFRNVAAHVTRWRHTEAKGCTMNVHAYREIQMPCGKRALVSDEDWLRVCRLSWSDNGKGYPRARWKKQMGGHGGIVSMHRFILSAPPGTVVDHINGDTLDNRRGNLQFITSSRNGMKANRGKSAGISFDKKAGKWRLRMRIDGNLKTLGWYLSREKALVALSMAREIVWSPALNPENYAPG